MYLSVGDRDDYDEAMMMTMYLSVGDHLGDHLGENVVIVNCWLQCRYVSSKLNRILNCSCVLEIIFLQYSKWGGNAGNRKFRIENYYFLKYDIFLAMK